MIPDGELYNTNPISAGTVSDLETAVIDTEQVGQPVGYGQGVQIKDGTVIPATKGHIFGIAVKRYHTNADHLYPELMANEKWEQGEMIGVLRDGTIYVPVNVDVNANENAAVDTDGNFKVAGASDSVVGVFLSSANAGSTARLQTRIQLANDAVTGTGIEDPNSTQANTTKQVTPAQSSSSDTSTSGTTNTNGGK
jgi:hypothetical protein